MRELKAALHLLDQDNRVRVIILSGAGKSFCAGLDLLDQNNPDSLRDTIGVIKAGSRAGMRAQEYMADIALLMRRIQQPIIAAVHGHAGRLVDDKQVRVLMDDPEFGAGYGRRMCPFGDADRWNTHQVALDQAVQLVDAALVDAHLARPQDAVNVAFRYTFTDAQQVVIDALSGFFFGDRDESCC